MTKKLRCFLILPLVSIVLTSQESASVMGASPSDGAPLAHPAFFPYQLENGALGYKDVVTFSNDAKTTGKVLEWGGQILVFDSTGAVVGYPLRDVRSFDLRRAERHSRRPDSADLTVAFVERTPRDTSWQGHITIKNGLPVLSGIDSSAAGPAVKPGDEVSFRVHVLNAGAAESRPTGCRVSIDGSPIGSPTTLPAIASGASHVVEAKWKWQADQHELRVDIDVAEGAEALRWNNTFTQPTRALAVTMVVAKDRYEAFRETPNLVDSFCFEDYAQYLVRNMNAIFADSVHPSAPEGVWERVFCDRILVVDDPATAVTDASFMASLRRGGKPGGAAEYSALLQFGKPSSDDNLAREALMVDWTMLQQLGRQLGLAGLNSIETAVKDCYVLDKTDRFAMLQYFSPWRASLMHTPGGFPLTEEQAAYLNQSLGRPRGSVGEYLYQLPENLSLKVLSNDGQPLAGVTVDVFQRQSDGPNAGRLIGIDREQPFVSSQSGEDGIAPMINIPLDAATLPGGAQLRPNPYGNIACDGSNGLLLLRLRYTHMERTNEEFHFLPLADCNVAYLRGNKQNYVHTLRTRFAPADASLPAPPFAAIEMWDRSTDHPPLILTWEQPKGIEKELIEEFRVYKRTGFAGQETKPWTLVSIHHPPEKGNFPHGIETYFDEFKYDGPYSLDTYFAVSTVDRAGRESNLSEAGFITHKNEAVRFAIHGMSALMTARGEGKSQMFFWDGNAGTHPHRRITDAIPDYKPAFEGIAFTPDGRRVVVTDPENHVLAFYDRRRSELIETWPTRSKWPGTPGEESGKFNSPADVAFDAAGNLYVADRGNHRVQILDSTGKFKGLLDPDFRFRGPHAIAYANGRICVTDKAGTRCRVYDIREGEPKLELQLPELYDADRAVVNPNGRVFITGRQSPGGEWTMLSFDPDGESGAAYSGMGIQGQMGSYERPRSIYQQSIEPQWVYLINCFPFDVRRLHIEQ